MKKILVVKTSSMGDIIHALPLAADIRAARPDLEVHWLAEESFADIPTLSPVVSRVHRTAFRRWRKTPFAAGVRAEVRALKKALRAERYDLALDVQGLLRSALAARWTGSPVAGYARAVAREPLASFFYDRKLNLPESLGAVRRYRMAAAEAIGYSLTEEAPRFGLEAKAKPSLVVDGPFAAFAVNTSRDEKLWPEERWVRLGEALNARGMKSVLFWGGASEEARCRRIAEAIPGALVAPRAPLAQVAATIARAELLVGVDTGLAHLGAALGRPSVGIFVSTPTETLRLIGDGPVASLGGVGVVPETDEVLAAVEDVLAAGRTNR